MAFKCTPTAITQVGKLCSGLKPGADELWLLSHASINSYTIGATSGMVDTLVLATGSFYAPIGILRNSLGIDTEGTIDVDKAIDYSTNTLTYKLGDLTIENQKHIKQLSLQPVSGIVKSRTGKRYVLGLEGELYLTAHASTTGKTRDDEVSYSITLSEAVDYTPYILNPVVTGIYGTAS